MATFTVTTLAGTGTGSLRDAIDQANANAGADTVVFASGLSGGTIDVTDGGAFGITDALTIIGDIDGDGSADITLDGQAATSIFTLTAATELDGLSLINGSGGAGGAIYTTSVLTVVNASFQGNSATSGGAIFAHGGQVNIENSDFVSNSSTGYGGAVYSDSAVTIDGSTFDGNSSNSQGAAILVRSATITSSSFEDNVATDGAIVAAVGTVGTVLDITSSTFANNSSTSGPGAAAANGSVVVRNSTFYGNSATDGAAAASYLGALELIDVTATANVGTSSIFKAFSSLSATNSIILGNTGTTFDGSVSYSGLNIVNFGSDTDTADSVINAASLGAVFVTSAGVAVLADNGGPVKTVALNPVSTNPAIDAGGLATDARGIDARDVPGIGTAAGDLGAYEYATAATNAGASSANGVYWLGQTISITVAFDQTVTVTGRPTLRLETGTTDREATYVSGSGTDTLTFHYIVQSGDTAADLDFASASALSLNGGTIAGPLGDASFLTLPAPGSALSLAGQAAIEVRGVTAPSGPVLMNALADQSAAEDAPFSFTMPAGTFTDANGDALNYSATLANGGALPAWLSFDAATRTFSGTPLNDHVGTIVIKVVAADGTGSASDEFTITVANTNDAPTAIALSKNSVAEHAAAGTVVGLLSVDDPDADDTATLSLIDSAGGRFALSGSQLVVAKGADLDFEQDTSYTVTVRATDAAGATFDRTLTIDIVDIVETVTGGKGNNVLKGSAGDDRIDGRAGNDRLTGGDGADTFVFGKGYGRDVITDFDPSEGDVIDLSGAVGIRNFRDLVRDHVEDTGRHLVITADDGSVLVLRNMDADDLGRDMFIF